MSELPHWEVAPTGLPAKSEMPRQHVVPAAERASHDTTAQTAERRFTMSPLARQIAKRALLACASLEVGYRVVTVGRHGHVYEHLPEHVRTLWRVASGIGGIL